MVTSWLNKVHCADWRDLCASLPPASVDAVITDPPYGITKQKGWDNTKWLDGWWQTVAPVCKPETVFVFTCTFPLAVALYNSQPKWFREELCWYKQSTGNFFNANRRHLRAHETILVFCAVQNVYNPQMGSGETYNVKRGIATSSPNFDPNTKPLQKEQPTEKRYPTSVIGFSNAKREQGQHPNKKPLALMEYLVLTYTNPKAVILDPFAGSGTTGAAAQKHRRNFILGDNDPKWCNHMRLRLAVV